MASSVTINGKEYVPSISLVSTCGYSSDYIAKLAREEKVLATQIGRQWFVEPESLSIFIQKAAIQKEIKKQELSEQRKLEQVRFSSENKNATSVSVLIPETKTKRHFEQKSPTAVALAEAMVVLVCTIFTGSLGWIAVSNGIGLHDLSVSAVENASFIAQAISPTSTNTKVWPVQQGKSYVAASDESVVIADSAPTQKQNDVYTSLPQFSNRYSTSSATSTLKKAQLRTSDTLSTTSIQRRIVAENNLVSPQLSVSDEVALTRDKDGNQIINPVFRDGTSSSEQFRIVSLKETKK